MVPMTFIWWIYHFWARFWPYFNFVDFRAYFGPFSLVNRVQFSNADAGAWNSFLRLGIIFYGKLMHKDTKFCYSSFDISTFGFKAPPYCRGLLLIKTCNEICQEQPALEIACLRQSAIIIIFIITCNFNIIWITLINCGAKAPLLHFIRSWVALSFRVSEWSQ